MTVKKVVNSCNYQGYNKPKKAWCRDLNQNRKPVLKVMDGVEISTYFEMCFGCISRMFEEFEKNHV